MLTPTETTVHHTAKHTIMRRKVRVDVPRDASARGHAPGLCPGRRALAVSRRLTSLVVPLSGKKRFGDKKKKRKTRGMCRRGRMVKNCFRNHASQ